MLFDIYTVMVYSKKNLIPYDINATGLEIIITLKQYT
jgi:hypothetical protein